MGSLGAMEPRPTSGAGGSLRGAWPVPAHPQGPAAATSQRLLSKLHVLRFQEVQKPPLGTDSAVSSLSPLNCSSVTLAGPTLAPLPEPSLSLCHLLPRAVCAPVGAAESRAPGLEAPACDPQADT